MGMQSLEFYSALAWLPTVFHDRGVSVVNAGLLLAATNTVAIFSALAAPSVAHRIGDVRLVVLAAVALVALGLTGLLADPHHLDVLWAVLLGSGQGASVSLALTVMVLRSSNQHQALALSGMAQGVGYLIAAVGPTLLGALYDTVHSWDLPLTVLLGLLVVQAGRGLSRSPRPARCRLSASFAREASSSGPRRHLAVPAVHAASKVQGVLLTQGGRQQPVGEALVGDGPKEAVDGCGPDGGVQR